MNAGLLGKIALGRASGDDILEMLSSFGMEMENEEIPSDTVKLVAVAEPIIRAGLDQGGQFRRVTMTTKDGGKMSALILLQNNYKNG
jgi:hypothetical protein